MKAERINTLDSTQREAVVAQFTEEEYDVLVIGGGITGAGIALDCSSRKMKTALVEMQDYGAGTSSRSTKLIHGGLRYLKQFEFRLVAEVGRERAIIWRNAPHVVVPEGMLLPVIKGGTFGKLGVSVGLYVYDILAGVDREERRKMLTKKETLALEPLLGSEGLQGSGLYSEYRTDDARLTIETVKTAVREGAHCLNYAQAVELIYEEGRVRGARIKDRVSGQSFTIRAREVVNAAGPWVDEVRKLDGSLVGKRLHHTKGVHLVLPHSRFPLRESVYFDIDDGRMMFAIPRGKVTYFGTTDTNYKGDPQDPYCSPEDAAYLISAVNRMFPGLDLQIDEIRSSWAGIRPLIHEEGKDPGELSRKDEIILSDSRLVTIAGGKLTGFRKMAQRVTDLVQERLIDSGDLTVRVDCHTDSIAWAGGDFPSPAAIGPWTTALAEAHGMEVDAVREWVDLFGTNTEQILEGALDTGRAEWPAAVLASAVAYSIQEEGCRNLGDFLIRRSGMLYFNRDGIPDRLSTIQGKLTELLGAEAATSEEFEREYDAVVRFKQQPSMVTPS
ncbi:UNVERIFIED_CONTAM: hypothetical protein GTU68_031029 [Idotea baltica]|nr:hypothetical protein [Idotea baltica]